MNDPRVQWAFLPIVLILLNSKLAAQSTDTAFKAYTQTIPGTEVSFKMVPIPAGTFVMGSRPQDQIAEKDEMPQRKVQVSAFWMGAYEVTHDEFHVFFNDETVPENSKVDAVTRPSPQYVDLSWGMGKKGGYPANSMQQLAALMYCRWLYQKTGVFYRLPTEAEWEYAARAGSTTLYPFGDDPRDLDKYAWHKGNSKNAYQKVGQRQPNAWGLYDMLGNVAEWTLDQYDENYYTTVAEGAADPVSAPTSRHPRTVRGGSYADEAAALRPANRVSWEPSWNQRDPQIPKSRWWLTDAAFVGFRIVRPLKQPTPEEAEAFYKKHIGQ
jgi:formylglycine-generating enzyme required for sulfatase activity